MSRKRLTEVFPGLTPLRTKQRVFCFYTKMKMDGKPYAYSYSDTSLPYLLYEAKSKVLNSNTGYDMVYQKNKFDNLKLAATGLNHLLIKPNEIFSFFYATKDVKKNGTYKDGLAEINGRIVPTKGGGLCQMSNLLFWVFLHSPLTIIERTGHDMRDFPEPEGDALLGVDATIAEGWIDLKMRNDTQNTYEIQVRFDDTYVYVGLYALEKPHYTYEVINKNLVYQQNQNQIIEEVDIVSKIYDAYTKQLCEVKTLYRNRCIINYKLPKDTPIQINTQQEKEKQLC